VKNPPSVCTKAGTAHAATIAALHATPAAWTNSQVTNLKIKSSTQPTAKVLMNGKIQIVKTSK
jgi:hypothetical protein